MACGLPVGIPTTGTATPALASVKPPMPATTAGRGRSCAMGASRPRSMAHSLRGACDEHAGKNQHFATPAVRCAAFFSCQFLAQNTHPYTSPEKGRKALLERLRQGM